MPVMFRLFNYRIYFWSNENDPLEPVHVHVSQTPTENATKIWILSDGTVQLEHNNSKIDSKQLKAILRGIEALSDKIVEEWEKRFQTTATFIDSPSRTIQR